MLISRYTFTRMKLGWPSLLTCIQEPHRHSSSGNVQIKSHSYPRDKFTNIPPSILAKVGLNLHCQSGHPLNLLKRRVEDFFYKNYIKRNGTPMFTMCDQLSPVVSVWQNFDSLLVPPDHPSRRPNDTYYINENALLRSHTSAHQYELMRSGLDAFLVFGDVYRRDEIDATHYPCFHQVEGVRLYTKEELFARAQDPHDTLCLFPPKDAPLDARTAEKQELHTTETAKMLEFELKDALQRLVLHLYQQIEALNTADVEYRWVETYFPFTHPSWEMEIKLENGQWMEMLGCGLIEQRILQDVGAGQKVGYAFGLGLERWAMKLFHIPDIRLFWSQDSGFLSQFQNVGLYDQIVYKPVSVFPPCVNDMSFWLPTEEEGGSSFSSNHFYDLVREVAGNSVEQVRLVDEFVHPKNGRRSHCYRIVYRDMCRTLTQEEVGNLHRRIADRCVREFRVTLR